jgi:hypothetical protein
MDRVNRRPLTEEFLQQALAFMKRSIRTVVDIVIFSHGFSSLLPARMGPRRLTSSCLHCVKI